MIKGSVWYNVDAGLKVTILMVWKVTSKESSHRIVFFLIILFKTWFIRWPTILQRTVWPSGASTQHAAAITTKGPFHTQFCTRDSNSIALSLYCISVPGHQNSTRFCTCLDVIAAMASANLYNNQLIKIRMKIKIKFYRIKIAMENIGEIGPIVQTRQWPIMGACNMQHMWDLAITVLLQRWLQVW